MLELARLWMRCRAELQMLRPNPNGMLQCYGETWRGFPPAARRASCHVLFADTAWHVGGFAATIDPPFLLSEGALQHRNLGQLLISGTTSRYTI